MKPEEMPFETRGGQLSVDEKMIFSASMEKRLQNIFPTENLRHAFENLVVTTDPSHLEDQYHAIEYKQELVLAIAEKGIVPVDALREHPALYIASGVDVALPLCLGARKIVMIDPIYSDPEIRDMVCDRIVQITQQQPKNITETGVVFLFDFGSGPEEVELQFNQTELDWEDSYKKLFRDIPTHQASIIFQFLPMRANLHHEWVADNVAPGGLLVLNDYQRRMQYDIQHERKVRDFLRKTLKPGIKRQPSPDPYEEAYPPLFSGDGYTYIPLKKELMWGVGGRVTPLLLQRAESETQ